MKRIAAAVIVALAFVFVWLGADSSPPHATQLSGSITGSD